MTTFLKAGAVVAVAAVVGGGAAYAVDSTQTPARTIIRTETPTAAVSASAPTGMSVNQIYRQDSPGVVLVTSTIPTTSSQTNPADPFGAPQQQQQQALGSGFVIDNSGHILTNAHVVLNASKVQVGFGSDQQDTHTYTAKVVGIDKSTDVAVLQVDAPSGAFKPAGAGQLVRRAGG